MPLLFAEKYMYTLAVFMIKRYDPETSKISS
jgi:hypothetical protein